MLVSRGFAYRYDPTSPAGLRVPMDSVTLDGEPIDPVAEYRVATNNFFASGGSGGGGVLAGTDRVDGLGDLAAMARYFEAHSPVSPTELDRVRRP